MLSTKRKRPSSSDYEQPTTSHTASEAKSERSDSDGEKVVKKKSKIPVLDDVRFEVRVLKDLKSGTPKSYARGKNSKADWTPPKAGDAVGPSERRVVYTIFPGSEWTGMKNYRKFVVGEINFGLGDHVFVNHSTESTGSNVSEADVFWVARVLEVRAHHPSQVFVRVYWYYWPNELPEGRRPYHGKNELIASNHMEIIDALTISEKAKIVHVTENEDELPADGLMWRQTYDVLTHKTSTLRKDCVCQKYHNPDKLLIRCSSEKCGKWLHEACLLEDALKTKWEHKHNGAVGNGKNGDGFDIIKTASNGASKANGVTAKPSKSKAVKPKKIPAFQPGFPWEGLLEAKLDMIKNKHGAETSQIAGTITITDLREDKIKNTKVNLECLFCRQKIT